MKKTTSYITVGLTLLALAMASCMDTKTLREKLKSNSSEAETAASDENSILKLQNEVEDLKLQVSQLTESLDAREGTKNVGDTPERHIPPITRGNNDTGRKPQRDAKSAAIQDTQEENGSKIYDVVEQMPSFPGGQRALLEYLRENVSYPTVAAENGIQGRVVVGFVVEKDGSIADVNVLKGQDPSLDREAVRVVKAMPKWIPGKANGTNVRVRYQVPVSFRMQ